MEDFFGIFQNIIYLEYIIGVVMVTEILKTYLPKPKSEFWSHPKWLTLFIGIGLGIVDAQYRLTTADGLNYSKLITSFGIATLSYDYIVKIIKDSWQLILNKLKKANDEVVAEDKKILDGKLSSDQDSETSIEENK